MIFAITAPITPSVAIEGQTVRFPVRRIFCVGRNYAEHSREMGGNPDVEPPFFFTKPADAVIDSDTVIPYPLATTDLHHEAELVVALAWGGPMETDAEVEAAIWGYAAGNDLTRRDLQAEAKAGRRPWDMAKGFDRSAVVGALRPSTMGAPSGAIRCRIGDRVTQEADLSEMIWSVPGILRHLATLVDLAPGDLIFTGTPSGVGPIARGETCVVEIDGLSPATVTLI